MTRVGVLSRVFVLLYMCTQVKLTFKWECCRECVVLWLCTQVKLTFEHTYPLRLSKTEITSVGCKYYLSWPTVSCRLSLHCLHSVFFFFFWSWAERKLDWWLSFRLLLTGQFLDLSSYSSVSGVIMGCMTTMIAFFWRWKTLFGGFIIWCVVKWHSHHSISLRLYITVSPDYMQYFVWRPQTVPVRKQ